VDQRWTIPGGFEHGQQANDAIFPKLPRRVYTDILKSERRLKQGSGQTAIGDGMQGCEAGDVNQRKSTTATDGRAGLESFKHFYAPNSAEC